MGINPLRKLRTLDQRGRSAQAESRDGVAEKDDALFVERCCASKVAFGVGRT